VAYIQSQILLSGTRTESPFLTDLTQFGELINAPLTSSPSKAMSESHMCSLRGAPSASFLCPSEKGALTQARSKPGMFRRLKICAPSEVDLIPPGAVVGHPVLRQSHPNLQPSIAQSLDCSAKAPRELGRAEGLRAKILSGEVSSVRYP